MKIISDEAAVERLLTRGVTEVIERDHLKAALFSGKQLRIKLGIDPTAPDLHLGHTVVLRKLREFQNLGHQAILIIGDFTALIGDPSGRSVERKPLTPVQVKANVKTYLKQAGLVLNMKTLEVVHNSKWFKKNALQTSLQLAAAGSVQQMLHRADFKKRLEQDIDITLLELTYPMYQGYDSVQVRADVELGGTDQKFNLLTGRRVQRHFKVPEQDVLMVPLLEGTDGVDKMSKSKGNYIGIAEPANEMFGKIMAIGDNLVEKYFELCTDTDVASLPVHPKEKKLRLAVEIVTLYHGAGVAQAAKQEFIEVFSKGQMPTEIPTVEVSDHAMTLLDLVMASQLVTSRSEARRLIDQGGVKINEVKRASATEVIPIDLDIVLQVGPRRFAKIVRK